MEEISWDVAPRLERPIAVLAFRGLFDAAEAATAAVESLSRRGTSSAVAQIDPELFFDFQQERPHITLRPDGSRHLVWPQNAFVATTLSGPRDLLSCAGVEPHLRWRSFCNHVIEVVRRCDAEMVVTLGAMVGLVPHTRPLPVTGSATNAALAARLGLGSPSYEGPTGVVGALHDALDVAGIPVISLRVTVPHYVPAAPNPKATAALLRRFEQVTGIESRSPELESAGTEWEAQVTAVATEDSQVSGYVRRLEEQFDAEEPLPSGDDLAAELEAFLREQRSDEG